VEDVLYCREEMIDMQHTETRRRDRDEEKCYRQKERTEIK
jgi:hypothetical protein